MITLRVAMPPAASERGTMSDDFQKAITLLRHIRQQIEDCFPVATIEQTFKGTSSVDFRIQNKANRYAVIVTRRFLDGHGDVDTGLAVLTSLRETLKRLDPGKVLIVNQNGLSTEAAGA
jgi:hypothetical protein